MTDETIDEPNVTEARPGFFHRGVLERSGWTETRDNGTHEISELLSVGPSFWSTPSAVEGEPPIVVRIRYDGSVCFPAELGRLGSAELRAFAAIADSERKDLGAGDPRASTSLFTLEPEQQARVNLLVQQFADAGVIVTSDEAQLVANIAAYGRQTIERSKTSEGSQLDLRTKKATELVSGTSKLSQWCLVMLAKLVVRQHTNGYDNDANLRALDVIDTLLHVLAVLVPDKKKLRHLHG